MSEAGKAKNISFIQDKVNIIKKECLRICVKAGKGHVTSAFSCAEIVAVLYYSAMRYDVENPNWEDRDRFIMSKNHGSVIIYPILSDLGFIGEEELNTFMSDGSEFGAHTKLTTDGMDFSGGSLGMGLGIAAGLAYAAKMDRKKWFTFALLGDGECYEGSIWEAAMFAGHNQLQNLIAIVDRNGLSATGFTEKMLRLEPLADKWTSFGWDVIEINGHDISALLDIFEKIRVRNSQKPMCIIANTVKGKGISFMINQPFMHGMAPAGDNIARAYTELDADIIKGNSL
jgi:transketolase